MGWIWQSPQWPEIDGCHSSKTEREIRAMWAKLAEMLARASASTLEDLARKNAQDELSASCAIDNLNIPGVAFARALAVGMGEIKLQSWFDERIGNIPDDPDALAALTRDLQTAIGSDDNEISVNLHAWHKDFMRIWPKNQDMPVGEFRNFDAGIFAGKRPIYVAPPHGELPGLMESFCAFMDHPAEDIVEILRKAALAHLFFVIVHPYGVGNGLLARLIDLSITSKIPCCTIGNGCPAFTLSRELLENKSLYYQQFGASQKRVEGKLDVSRFIDWHGHMAANAMRESMRKLARTGIRVPGRKARKGRKGALVEGEIKFTGCLGQEVDYDIYIGKTLFKHCTFSEFDDVAIRKPGHKCRLFFEVKENDPTSGEIFLDDQSFQVDGKCVTVLED